MEPARLLVGLDADQRRAVTDRSQPLAILAGAGSGKTRVLTRRIAYRASLEPDDGGADPRHVLALTFTRKAAAEMRSRLGTLGLIDRPTVGTFHAIAWAQLRNWHLDNGRALPGLVESKGRILASIAGRGSAPVAEVASEIDWARARDLAPGDYPRAAHQADRRISTSFDHVAALIDTYEAEKRRRRVIDFDDILGRCADLLNEDPTFAAAQRWRFRHLFVDEFQDVNPLQHRLLRGWLGDRPDLCVVGDANQAIYRWNGADARYLLRFADTYPGSRTVHLTGSYRSTPQILHVAASALGPSGRSNLVARRPDGAVPTITSYETDIDEAHGAASEARLLRPPGTRWDRQAVLVRTNAQMALVQEAFTHQRIPVRLRGGDPLLSRPDVRQALRELIGDGRGSLAVLLADLDAMVVEAEQRPAGEERADALGSVLRLGRELAAMEPTAKASDLRGWLTTALGVDGPGEGGDAVSVVTFHAAKGLEWPIVHVLGVEDGLVPISYAKTPEAEAEERRLLYVAVTRAEDVLRLTWSRQRDLRGSVANRRPSPFLAEIARTIADLHAAARPVAPDAGLGQARKALARTVEPPSRDPAEVLLGDLRAWRSERARRGDVPVAVVMSDRVLSDIAHRRPGDLDALATVLGMSVGALAEYGEELVDLVSARGEPSDRP